MLTFQPKLSSYLMLLSVCLFGSVLFGANPANLQAAEAAADAKSNAAIKYRVGLPSGARVVLPAQRVGGRVYLALKDVAKGLFNRAPIIESGTALSLSEGILRCPSVSFYIALESSDGIRVAQMAYPSIERDNKLYLPAEPFFRALQVLGIYWVERTTVGYFVLRFPAEKLWAAGEDHEFGGESNDTYSPGPISSSRTTRSRQNSSGDSEYNGGSSFDGTDSGEAEDDGLHSGPYVAPDLSTPNHYRIPADLQVREQSGAVARGFEQEETISSSSPGPNNQAGAAKPRYRTTFENPVRRYDSLTPPARRQYILPPDLRRRERTIDSSHSAILRDPSGVAEVSAPLASLLDPSMLTSPAGVAITDVKAQVEGGLLKLRFEAGASISSYQRPEFNGTRLIIRFPETSHDAAGWVDLPETEGIAAVAQENIRGIQVYRLRFTTGIKDVKHKRLAGNVIEFSVQLAEQIDANERLARESDRWKLDVIVIDPGHGGKDPGAIGVTGVREKDVVLRLSLLLGKMIEENMPETKVVYTRDDDTFIELYRRGQIANEAGGKLFISVHANSVAKPSKTARGFETFILRPGRNEDAVKVAERENSVVKFEQNVDRYKTLTDEEFIVVNMAQKAFVKFSEKFATMLQEEIDKSTPLNNRGVNQAGFFVLVGASMPNVLFEAAFLSNKSDEKYLNTKKGIQELAEGMYNSIVRYRDYLQKVNSAGN